MNNNVIQAADGFSGFRNRVETMLDGSFQNNMRHVDGLRIGRNSDGSSFRVAGSMLSKAMYMSQDSLTSPAKHYVAGRNDRQAIRMENPSEVIRFVASRQDALAAKGMSQDSIHAAVKKDLMSYMTYDSASGQYVIKPVVAKVNDSIISNSSLPYWNIGFLNRVFKQPFAKSFARNLVSVESFGNPWADTLMVFKESFEGYGRISNIGKGTVQGNSSNPVTSEFGVIATETINLAIDYDSNVEEALRGGSGGNPLSGQAFGDRERYADMMLRRIHDALIIFGNPETGTDGLTQLATGGVVAYTGTPLNAIVDGVSTTKGSLIVAAMNQLIGEYLRECSYMVKNIKINCSTYVMKALLSTVYSDQYNPASPMQVLNGTFDATKSVGGELQRIGWTLVADPMLDPNTPFNPNGYDLFIITAPTVDSDLDGSQDGLVIAPVPLEQFIIPPMYQRSGMLYTMIKRVGGVIAPVVNTVRVWSGFGFVA